MIKIDDIVRGMTMIMPILKPFQGIPLVHKIAEKILIFEKL